MKTTFTLLIMLLLRIPAGAQGVFGNQVNSTLEKVVQDYPSQFKNIRGELLSTAAGTSNYKSNIAIPGAVSTIITQTAADRQEKISWQSVVYTSNQFEQASTRFEEMFNQIKNTVIRAQGEKAV